jgi:hypothetical protein
MSSLLSSVAFLRATIAWQASADPFHFVSTVSSAAMGKAKAVPVEDEQGCLF